MQQCLHVEPQHRHQLANTQLIRYLAKSHSPLSMPVINNDAEINRDLVVKQYFVISIVFKKKDTNNDFKKLYWNMCRERNMYDHCENTKMKESNEQNPENVHLIRGH